MIHDQSRYFDTTLLLRVILVDAGELSYDVMTHRHQASCQAFKHDYFSYFPDRYLLSITMVFGATIAGDLVMLQ